MLLHRCDVIRSRCRGTAYGKRHRTTVEPDGKLSLDDWMLLHVNLRLLFIYYASMPRTRQYVGMDIRVYSEDGNTTHIWVLAERK